MPDKQKARPLPWWAVVIVGQATGMFAGVALTAAAVSLNQARGLGLTIGMISAAALWMGAGVAAACGFAALR